MNESKKYLGLKRKKIFSIEKVYPKGTPKVLPQHKINISPIPHLFGTEQKSTKIRAKKNLNFEESEEKLLTENQRHSLICISRLVFEYLQQIENTTGNEVTDYIKNALHSKKNDQPNQKNIQRRVYDAINVMSAVGLIKKNRQEIQFLKKINKKNNIININNNIINENEKSNVNREIKDENKEVEKKIKEKTKELEEKRKNLIKAYLSLKFYEKYNSLNEGYPQRKLQKQLEFPFDIIIYDNSFPIKFASKEDLSRYLIVSNSEFIHYNQYDIIKKLISSDIITKLNESNKKDNNSNMNKTNSKKSTNDDCFLEDVINSNINNINHNNMIEEQKEEQKIEENARKIKKLNDSLNNGKSDESKKNNINSNHNENKIEDDIAFNYLKNIKIFKDELVFNEEEQGVALNHNENNHEPIENNIGKENDNENIFSERKIRKSSNISYFSNLYEENSMKNLKGDNISEMGMY
jgi:hypothetical protein